MSKTGGNWRPGDWKCSKCNIMIFGSKNTCSKCGELKNSVKSNNPNDWKCPRCQNLVFGYKKQCRCDQSGQSGQPGRCLSYANFPDSRKSLDWTCACGELVFGSRINCRKCGACNTRLQTQSNQTQNVPQSPPQNDNGSTCVICLNKQCIYLPSGCGHFCMCEECAIHPSLTQCPMCRKDFSKLELVKVYAS